MSKEAAVGAAGKIMDGLGLGVITVQRSLEPGPGFGVALLPR